MEQPKILAFAGSLRKDSYNKKLVKIAVKGAEEAGAKVTYIDLKDYPLPVYDQEIEDSTGIPENALKLKKLFLDHHGFLISCPEYNSSMPAAFKNAIDWISRPASPDEVYLSPFIDKVVALMSASPGQLRRFTQPCTCTSYVGEYLQSGTSTAKMHPPCSSGI